MLGGAILGPALVLRRGLTWSLLLTGMITLTATLAYVAQPAAGEGG